MTQVVDWAIFQLPCASVSKRVLVRNPYENNFDLHENEPLDRTHFHINGFAQGFEAKDNSEMA